MSCPECGHPCKNKTSFGCHRRRAHGIAGETSGRQILKRTRAVKVRRMIRPRGKKKNFDATGALHVLAGADWRKRRAA